MPHDHDHQPDIECGHCSGHSFEEIEKKMMDDIIKHGHQVRFIFPSEGSDAATFWYSIGRSMKNRPELLITGPLDPRVGMWIINEAAKLDDDSPLVAGQEIPANALLNEYPVRIVAADPLAASMHGALNYFGDDVTALQIVWPDMDGKFPGDEGFAFPDAEPVFGVAP